MTTVTGSGGTGSGGTGTSRSRRVSLAWTGLLPFFAFVGLVFLVPIGYILFDAFRRTVTGASHRNPVTQQFEHTTTTTFTGANISDSLHGVYLTDLLTSVKLSAAIAAIGAVLGVVLAYAVVSSKAALLRQVVTSASAVLANFGGIPLAFMFIATIDANSGIVSAFMSQHLGIHLFAPGGALNLQGLAGLGIVYLYFLIPLMVLVMTPALEGLKPQWGEAAENLGASRWNYWRLVAAPVLLPSFLGSLLLLFCSSFSAYATAYAINSSNPLVTIAIQSVLSGNVLPGQQNLGAALALDMIVVVLPLTIIYQLLQRRTTRWLA